MQQLNTSRNIPGMAMLAAMLCLVGGGIVSLVAWDELWLIIGVAVGVAVALYLLLTETNHLRQIEVKEIEFNHKKLLPPSAPVIDITPTPKQPQLLPDIMAPKSEMHLLETAENHFVRPEAPPVKGNGVYINGWPRDVESLRVAYWLMTNGRVPTRANFIKRGMKSGSRYDSIRAWLVEVGLAQSFGDGNTTRWTSDAYDFGIQANIKKYLSQVPHSNEIEAE